MAWMKKRGQTTPTPAGVPTPTPVQMYNPNQHANQEVNWQQDSTWYNRTQQPNQTYNYQQQPQPYWEPYTLQQQGVNTAVQNQSYQQNTAYSSQYNPNSTYNYGDSQNSLYTQKTQVRPEGDTWDWGWGDEDNSNVHSLGSSNANVNQQTITDSFANDETWNWSLDETNLKGTEQVSKGSLDAFQRMGTVPEKHTDDDLAQPQDALVSGKRGKNDLLTPQWSTESQMSQESSDDILHTSGSEKILSRASTVSQSPVSAADTQDNNKDIQSAPRHIQTIETHAYYRQDGSPCEISAENSQVVCNLMDPESASTKPTPMKAQPKMEIEATHHPLALGSQSPPIHSDLKNPYKRATVLSHKAANNLKTAAAKPEGTFYQNPPFVTTAYNTQSVNLETLPDNSEQPDVLPGHQIRKQNFGKPPLPDNNEVAPMNDRNQYLETGKLSDESTSNLQMEGPDALPPPGLHRMVLGQMEQNERSLQLSDEPPPGLSRMVLGQTRSSPSLVAGVLPSDLEPRLPTGLHRMIPGESSPPETALQFPSIERQEDDYISDTELNQLHCATPQQRSATIGADTPPALFNPQPLSETLPAVKQRETNFDGANSFDAAQSTTNVRRESIEGQPQDRAVANLVSTIRDLTVGENPTDATTFSFGNPEPPRKPSRESESDSEREHELSPHERKHKEKGGDKYRRDRYSPDTYRKYDKKRHRDRKYDDDTADYYSDRERDRRRQERDKREEYERKYASLRRDKDKERRRRDPRDGRRDYYYDRYPENYDNPPRSRPSSRSDSMHESYRERGQDRDHRRPQREKDPQHRRPRDSFNPYAQGYPYDTYGPYYQQYQYQYYENLRRTNPQAYAEWYRKYYQQQTGAQTASFGTDDRASVHSGRSSANEELSKDRYNRQSYYSQSSLPRPGGYYRESRSISGQFGLEETSYSRPFDQPDSSLHYDDQSATSQRLTPAKFATAHIKASITSGRLVKVLPNYPLDGQSANVELSSLEGYFNDDEFKQLSEFPGPLVKGVTHKKTIIEYCENKIRKVAAHRAEIVDSESYVLMWELLILLLRQNGMVVGTDIAELLMKNYKSVSGTRPSSVASSTAEDPSEASNAPTSEMSNSGLKEDVVTNRFREYLIYGSGKEALEWAMKHGLWGHALFLASKLDKRTYANVMMRFANGLTMNDPLQTLYQMLSGRLPASVTSVADEKWGDWRPHLAMILSNASQRPELERKAITTLADTLFGRGNIYAAQFCYLMAQVDFRTYGSDGAKLVLLGSNQNKPFLQFATNAAIHMTEVYEYACKLNDSAFMIPQFQPYKYLLSTRMADRGLLEKSLAYLEQVAYSIVQNPSTVEASLVNRVCDLADRLKYYDPVGDADDGNSVDGDLDISRPDNSWLKDLRTVQNDFNMGLISHDSENNLAVETPELDPQNYEQQSVPAKETWPPQYQQPNQQWQPQEQIARIQTEYQQHPPQQQQESLQESYSGQYQVQQQYWSQQQQNVQQWGENDQSSHLQRQYPLQDEQQSTLSQLPPTEYWNAAPVEQEGTEKETAEDAAPQISMPNQQEGRSAFGNLDTTTNNSAAAEVDKKSPVKTKKSPAKQEKGSSAGWFGGIFNRLALRPKNQMKLPDDKNPSIVWDPEKKSWVNLDEEGTEVNNELKPPPKMSDMFPKNPMELPPPSKAPLQNVANLNNYSALPMNIKQESAAMQPVATGVEDAAPKAAQPNMFKLQGRGRSLKNSYVDVFNPSGKPSSAGSFPAPSTFDPFGGAVSSDANMKFFVPPPVADPNAPLDFLTSASAIADASQQMMYQHQSS